jgi:hypothetical protein
MMHHRLLDRSSAIERSGDITADHAMASARHPLQQNVKPQRIR